MTLLFASPVCRGAARVGLRAPAGGDRVPGLRVRVRGARPQHVYRRVLPSESGMRRSSRSTRCWAWAPALAPVFALIFVGLGFWWGLPVLVGTVTLVLLLFTSRLPLQEKTPVAAGGAVKSATGERSKVLPRFWVYAAFALVYGICETMNANWASVYLSTDLRASTGLATLALDGFLGCRHGRARSVCHHRKLAAAPVDVPASTRPARVGLRRRGGSPISARRPGTRCFRRRRSGLFGLAAAGHQFRANGVDLDGSGGGGRPDRLLPDRLWHRGLRRRAAANMEAT